MVFDSPRPEEWTCDNDGAEMRTCSVHETRRRGNAEILTLHVDYGSLPVKRSDPTYHNTKKFISEQFDINVLARYRRSEYMNNLEPMAVPTTKTSPEEKTDFPRLLAQV